MRFLQKWLYKGEFEFLFEKPESEEVVVIDTETTGLDTKKDEIISIAAIKVRKNHILTSKSLYLEIAPKDGIKKESIKIHKLRSCDLKGAIEAKEALRRFLYFIKNRPLVGYYLEFDIKMIDRYLKEFFGLRLPNRQIEVSGIYHDYKQKAIPQGFIDLKFDTILNDLDIPKLKAHNAFNDAIMTAMIYLKLKRRRYGKSSSF